MCGYVCTWILLLAVFTHVSMIFMDSSSDRVGFSPVVPHGTMPAVLFTIIKKEARISQRAEKSRSGHNTYPLF
jgi:hypothetical protein